ncbi:unnamed protein product [Acanthoscelides obtectus]|uniref:NTF2 domain-containing protein n=1 Tax=Acanthoscelides obtectus TaxID=200917 RepID=A0A9P0PPQ4_ACAOB|nr:unnamed protein product [Acanthoscelides obtectus]CAK1638660.1 hypothetical protein AOBTE_LOCUS10740 [Acanthoscelides obtectus]
MANLQKSHQGIKEILSKLDEHDVIALASTDTQGLLKVASVDEAVNGILKHSPTLVSIMRRKIVTKEILFQYLDENNVSFKSPASKNDLIDRIIEYWNESLTQTVLDEPVSSDVKETSPGESEQVISQLADQFAKWFYTMLNSDEGVGTEHFYANAKLKIAIVTDEGCDLKEVEDNPEKLQHQLYFNPNFTNEGIQGRIDPHGLVMVFTCGTLHVKDAIVGVFEQVFSLARDPFCDNNWTIKKQNLTYEVKIAL